MTALQLTPALQHAYGAKLDDIGNAERFVAQHGDVVRYVPQWKTWLVWDGMRWKIDHDATETLALARSTARSIFVEATDASSSKKAKRLVGWASESARPSRLKAMITIARSDLCVGPDALDAQPYLLNVANGTVDLRTGKLRPHDPDDLLTKVSSTRYVPEAQASTPAFDQFMQQIFLGRNDLIEYTIRLLGYALSGDTTEHILPVLYGAGRNGKSVLLQAVQDAVGADYVASVHESVLTPRSDTHPTSIADLQGLRIGIGIAPETDKASRLSCENIKRLCGERRIKARRMRSDFYEFERTFTLFLVTNQLPRVDDETESTWRRLRVVPFDFVVPEDQVDRRLGKKLRAERVGILAKLVRGCRDALAGGLDEPDEVWARTERYRAGEDRGQLVSDPGRVAECVSARLGNLQSQLSAWCKTEGRDTHRQRAWWMGAGSSWGWRYRSWTSQERAVPAPATRSSWLRWPSLPRGRLTTSMIR